MLLDKASDTGAQIMINTEVTDIESAPDGSQTVLLKDGTQIRADVVIGADGMSNFVF